MSGLTLAEAIERYENSGGFADSTPDEAIEPLLVIAQSRMDLEAENALLHEMLTTSVISNTDLAAEVERLRAENNGLRIDLDLANCSRRDALKTLELFRGYDGDDDLWAAMKQERDEAVEKVSNILTTIPPEYRTAESTDTPSEQLAKAVGRLVERIGRLEKACDIFEKNSANAVEMYELLRMCHWNAKDPAYLRSTEILGKLEAMFEPKAPRDSTEHQRGLYQKYNVTRTDGSSNPGRKHYGCEYFVLDITHDRHAVPALAAYAASCEGEWPQLASDLRKKLALGGTLDQPLPKPPLAMGGTNTPQPQGTTHAENH